MVTPLTGRFSAWTDLLTTVDQHAGVFLVPMETLRKIEGAHRIGDNIRDNITSKLRTLGFGSLPAELPKKQTDFVILYRLGTPAAEVISAISDGLKGAGLTQTVYNAMRTLNTLDDKVSAAEPETPALAPEEVDRAAEEAGEAAKEVTSNTVRVLLGMNGETPAPASAPVVSNMSTPVPEQAELEPAARIRSGDVATGFSS